MEGKVVHTSSELIDEAGENKTASAERPNCNRVVTLLFVNDLHGSLIDDSRNSLADDPIPHECFLQQPHRRFLVTKYKKRSELFIFRSRSKQYSMRNCSLVPTFKLPQRKLRGRSLAASWTIPTPRGRPPTASWAILTEASWMMKILATLIASVFNWRKKKPLSLEYIFLTQESLPSYCFYVLLPRDFSNDWPTQRHQNGVTDLQVFYSRSCMDRKMSRPMKIFWSIEQIVLWYFFDLTTAVTKTLLVCIYL